VCGAGRVCLQAQANTANVYQPPDAAALVAEDAEADLADIGIAYQADEDEDFGED
jgi:hypothetical protein